MIPYLDKFSIIGTTDVEYKGDPREVSISDDEVDYLIDIVNQHFVHQLTREDVFGHTAVFVLYVTMNLTLRKQSHETTR